MGRRTATLVLAALALVGQAAVSQARAETVEEIFERGNAAYEKGSYEDALEAYRTVARYGVADARVEYNMANAAFKLGRVGEAILHYEKALKLDPTDADTAANLELARSRCFDRVEPTPVAAPLRVLRGLQDRLGPDRQAMAVLACVWIAAGLVAWRASRPGGWNAMAGWGLAFLVLVIVLGTASWHATWRRLDGRQLAVVLQETAEVLAGPGANNASLFVVHEGLTVEVEAEREEWIQVSLPNGLHGWMPKDALGLV